MGRTDRARITLSRLRDTIDRPATELQYANPYELLVAVILSAQCTDKRVNKTTPALFDAFPTVEDMAQADAEDIYPYIKSVTFPNNKSGYLAKMARKVCDEFDGEIPDTVSDLQKLSGVGRKTAQVVVNVAFDMAALPVDTHVYRTSHRIGLVTRDANTPTKVERQLKRIIPREDWGDAHHLLILHGRYTCTARNPSCESCVLTDICNHYTRLQRLPDPLPELSSRQGNYFCRTCDSFFDEPDTHVDRYDIEQTACPRCNSMMVFRTRDGQPTKQPLDFRVNG